MQWFREVSWFCRHASNKINLSTLRRWSFLATVHYLWKAKNMAVFQKLCPSVSRVLSNAKFVVTVKLNLYSQNSYCEA